MSVSKQFILLVILLEFWCVSTFALWPCGSDTFVCDDGNCIPMLFVCSGNATCKDGSDQIGCESGNPPKCSKKYFHCTTSRECLPIEFLCDGEESCDDGSDEWNCTTACRDDEFECLKNEECVPAKSLCDGKKDCKDGSDERSCREDVIHDRHQCGNKQFLCERVLQCVYRQFLCDGELDCIDGTDENLCGFPKQPCPDGYCDRNGDCVVGGDRYYCNCSSSSTGEKCELRAAAERAFLDLGIVIGIAMAAIIL